MENLRSWEATNFTILQLGIMSSEGITHFNRRRAALWMQMIPVGFTTSWSPMVRDRLISCCFVLAGMLLSPAAKAGDDIQCPASVAFAPDSPASHVASSPLPLAGATVRSGRVGGPIQEDIPFTSAEATRRGLSPYYELPINSDRLVFFVAITACLKLLQFP